MPCYPLKLDTKRTSNDSQLSALALATGYQEWNDLDTDNCDYYGESIGRDFDSLDHEAAFIDALNLEGTQKADEKTKKAIRSVMSAGPFSTYLHTDTDLLFGAWYALTIPEAFAEILEAWTSARKEELHETLGDYSHMPEPYATKLQEAYNWYEENAFDEYVKGDRSNDGLLVLAAKEIFGRYISAAIEWQKYPADELCANLDDDAVREYLEANSADLGNELETWLNERCPEFAQDGNVPDTCPLPPAEMLGATLSAIIDYMGEAAHLKRMEEHAKRKAENEKTREYKAARVKADEAARIAKLNNMKR